MRYQEVDDYDGVYGPEDDPESLLDVVPAAWFTDLEISVEEIKLLKGFDDGDSEQENYEETGPFDGPGPSFPDFNKTRFTPAIIERGFRSLREESSGCDTSEGIEEDSQDPNGSVDKTGHKYVGNGR